MGGMYYVQCVRPCSSPVVDWRKHSAFGPVLGGGLTRRRELASNGARELVLTESALTGGLGPCIMQAAESGTQLGSPPHFSAAVDYRVIRTH